MQKLKCKCGRKCCMYNKAKKSNRTRHWDVSKDYAKVLEKVLRQAHWQHISKILLAGKKQQPQPLWNYIQSQNQDNIAVALLKSKGDYTQMPTTEPKSLLTNSNVCSPGTLTQPTWTQPLMDSLTLKCHHLTSRKLVYTSSSTTSTSARLAGLMEFPVGCWRSWLKKSPLH